MGKSIKKAKSERINALRKQYDAFLEEDRKRKNRNDYIIGWLDKLQTSSTVSTVRFQESATSCHHMRLLQRPEYDQKKQNLSPLLNIKCPSTEKFEEAALLKAVSQKYILIPKISPEQNKKCNECNDKTLSAIENDSDWKRKYNILDELKQHEKEEQISSGPTKYKVEDDAYHDVPTKDVLLTNQNSSFVLHFESQPLEEIVPRENINEIPSSATNSKQNNQYKFREENVIFKSTTLTNSNELDIKGVIQETKPLRDCSETNTCSEKSEIQETQFESLKDFENEHVKEINNDKNVIPLDITKTNYNTINDDLILENVTDQSEINYGISSETMPENSITVDESQHYNSSPIELSDIKEVTKNNKLPTEHLIGDYKDTRNEIVNLEEHSRVVSDLANISEPQLENDVKTPQCVEDNKIEEQSQIEEFESEQKELFNSEEQNVNYSYNEEQVTGDIYENNEQYSYYEATKEDPNQYVTTVNDHEESTEQYDPHYQQQFSTGTYEENPIETQYTTEDYPQNEGEDYQQQQFYENYGPQQTEYEESQGNKDNFYIQDYTQDTISQNEELQNVVERQLNIEEGYPADGHTVVANINEENSEQAKLSTNLNVA